MDEGIQEILHFEGEEDFIKFLKENMSIEHDKLLNRLLSEGIKESLEKTEGT